MSRSLKDLRLHEFAKRASRTDRYYRIHFFKENIAPALKLKELGPTPQLPVAQRRNPAFCPFRTESWNVGTRDYPFLT